MSLGAIPLGDAPYATPWYSVGQERCENLFLEYSSSTGAKASYYFLGIPGLRRFVAATASVTNPCRGSLLTSSGRAFMVFGRSFQEITQSGARSFFGYLDSTTGTVKLAENGKQILVVDGAFGYIFDLATSTFQRIADEYFPGGTTTGGLAPTHVECIDTYFLVNAPGTNIYYWSNPYYGNDNGNDWSAATVQGYWNSLRSGMKIGRPDNIIGMTQAQSQLWLFGVNSLEVHYDTGDSLGQLFARYSNAMVDIGCNAKYSPANYGSNVFWLGSDKTGTTGVFSNEGLTPIRISVRGIEQLIDTMADPTDCIGYCSSQAGHTFYVMWFPSAEMTLVYDLTTKKWHMRTYLHPDTGAVTAWHGLYPIEAYGKNLWGDLASDAVYFTDMAYYQNDAPTGSSVNYIKAVKTVPIVFANGVRVRHNSIQPMFQQGVGVVTGYTPGTSTTDPMQAFGRYPQCAIAFSDDGGASYKNELFAPLGPLGETTNRTIRRRLGLSRNRVYRFTITDPVRRIFVGCIADMTLGAN